MDDRIQALGWFFFFSAPGFAFIVMLMERYGTGDWNWKTFFDWLALTYLIGTIIALWVLCR